MKLKKVQNLNKAYQPIYKKSIDVLEDRTIVVVGSTPDVDRAEESIPLEAWDLNNYNKNPIVLLHHDYTKPIGKALWTKKDPAKGLIFKIQFFNNAEGNEIYRMYKEGVMNSFSVGFLPKKAKRSDGTAKIVYQDVELLELSCVTVPANPNAIVLEKSLINAYKEDKIHSEDLKDIIKKYLNLGDFMKNKSVKKTSEPKSKEQLNASEKLFKEKKDDVSDENKKNEEQENKPSDKAEKQENNAVKKDIKNVVEKVIPITSSDNVISIKDLYRILDQKAYAEGIGDDVADVFPKDYPNGSCILYVYGKDMEHYYEYEYTINESLEVTFNFIKEVELKYVKKTLNKIDKNFKIVGRVEKSMKDLIEFKQYLEEDLKNIKEDLKIIKNYNIINNELKKDNNLNADKNINEISKEVKNKENTENIEESNEISKEDIIAFKKSIIEDIKGIYNPNEDIKAITKEIIKKEFGEI